MKKSSFHRLHRILKPYLDEKFPPKEGCTTNPGSNKYLITSQIRLSIANRFFAGGSPYDIILTHGVSYASIFISIWCVVHCVNRCLELLFSFPDHTEQKRIAS